MSSGNCVSILIYFLFVLNEAFAISLLLWKSIYTICESGSKYKNTISKDFIEKINMERNIFFIVSLFVYWFIKKERDIWNVSELGQVIILKLYSYVSIYKDRIYLIITIILIKLNFNDILYIKYNINRISLTFQYIILVKTFK